MLPTLRQLNRISECNKAIFAAGGCEKNSHIITSSVITPDALEKYKNKGAKGVLCTQLIDKNGDLLQSDLQERVIAIDLKFLKKLEMGILVSSGNDRVEPMVATINSGYVTHLVTNTSTAESILNIK